MNAEPLLSLRQGPRGHREGSTHRRGFAWGCTHSSCAQDSWGTPRGLPLEMRTISRANLTGSLPTQTGETPINGLRPTGGFLQVSWWHHPSRSITSDEPAASPGWSQQPARPEKRASRPKRTRRSSSESASGPPLTILALDVASRARRGPRGSSSDYGMPSTPTLEEVIVKKIEGRRQCSSRKWAAQGA